jgi:riboflavin synthase
MFTGIIEEIGKVKSIKQGTKSAQIYIAASKVIQGTLIGDSIATNGVCLTVTELHPDGFVVDAMNETLTRSTLKSLKQGTPVNLERALTLQTRMGGHMVNGHVDGVGRIANIRIDDIAKRFIIQTQPELTKYMVEKGSITVDGISLTIVAVSTYTVEVSVIPHTQYQTTLYDKKVDDMVNIECDILAKYIEKLGNSISNEKLSESMLKSYGY